MADSDNIIPEQIDETFPVAGQDNDSQGFRDNFAVIQTSLSSTKAALQDLESKVLLKDALTGTTLDNDLQGNKITNGVLQGVSSEHFNTGNITGSGDTTIEWSTAEYQDATLAADGLTLTLGGWPATGVYAKMRIALRSNTGVARTVGFSAGAGTIRVDQTNWATALTNGDFVVESATSPMIVDAWTVDGGITVFLEYIGNFTILS
jgi:hypothetical protein